MKMNLIIKKMVINLVDKHSQIYTKMENNLRIKLDLWVIRENQVTHIQICIKE